MQSRRFEAWYCKSCGKEVTVSDVRILGRPPRMEMETLCCGDWIRYDDGRDVDELDFLDELPGPFDERD